jgi:hypothetical protein
MPSSLKKWIESHPAAVLIGLGVSVAATASSVTAYLSGETHKAEKTELQAKFIADKNELQSKYTNEVRDLTTRLSSIERRAGSGSEKRYLDVQSFQISSPEVRSLPGQYTGYENGRFFVNAPISEIWSYVQTTEGQAIKSGPFKSEVEAMEKLAGAGASAMLGDTAHLWVSKSPADVSITVGAEVISGPMSSFIYVMKTDSTQIAKKMAAFRGMAGRVAKKPSDTAVIEKAVSEIETLRSQKSPSDADSDTALAVTFEKLYAGDAAGLMFIDVLTSAFLPVLASPSISLSLHSAQKQLNVMYVDAELTFENTTISNSIDDSCRNGTGRTMRLRREVFFVSYGRDGYMIRIDVPSCDGRARAFDWISQWLAGLKIVILG